MGPQIYTLTTEGKINRGRHTDHPAGRHSIRTNKCPPPLSPILLCDSIITFCVSRRRRKMYCDHARLCVCLSVRAVRPNYCTDPDVTWGHGIGLEGAPSCALLSGFAIGARVALLWQHNANPSYH